ncbi:hypothetical protein GGR88_000004 [Sphingomonas jejuensis]|uniref:Uncharacterized protein n=1 Tax=Sphingomonas jejuensis TaxID=904715 RepID=A0ABX0XH50_9SPHN|nr:hypothetical protein [Sphingomonas jejuensis]NJC32530.1 hypothetical protein [Sphingomonas jejuensis]
MRLFLILAATATVASPALASDRRDTHWLDYRTDIAEARRELASDLRRADTRQDRNEAYAEYRRELADARRDYNQEVRERRGRRGTVRVED